MRRWRASPNHRRQYRVLTTTSRQLETTTSRQLEKGLPPTGTRPHTCHSSDSMARLQPGNFIQSELTNHPTGKSSLSCSSCRMQILGIPSVDPSFIELLSLRSQRSNYELPGPYGIAQKNVWVGRARPFIDACRRSRGLLFADLRPMIPVHI